MARFLVMASPGPWGFVLTSLGDGAYLNVGWLDGLLGVAGIIIAIIHGQLFVGYLFVSELTHYYGSFPKIPYI